ncbi:MAG: aminoglycoside phosphotransferase family protein, partial [Chthoniobacterales bacterium]|nr:aminoglycoside phosphotransferase family protein [Chthoniobacterales bacterium]
MLSPADLELIERDPALPGLRWMLDAEALAQLLAEEVSALELRQIEINYVRYKPATNCLSGFLLQTSNGRVYGYARAFRLSALGKLGKEKRAHAVPGSLGPHRIVVERLGIVISTAANDRKLDSLGRLGHKPACLLKNMLPAYPDLGHAILEPVNYKPARRFVGKLMLEGQPAAVLKIYSEGEYEKARHAAYALSSAPAVTTVIGHSTRDCMLVFRWVEGTPLNQLLTDQSAVGKSGAALRRFHSQTGIRLPLRSNESLFRQLSEAAHGIAILLPAFRERARALAQSLSASIGQTETDRATLHGDFYAHQVLVRKDGEIVLLDCDEAAIGDPRYDLGNFLAHLQRRVLTGGLTAVQGEAARDSFLAGYGEIARPRWLTECRPFIGAALLRLAHEPFRKREPDWPAGVDQLLDCAESFVDGTAATSVSGRAPSVSAADGIDPRAVIADEKMPYMAAALDFQQAGAALKSTLAATRNLHDVRLRGVRIARYKPGRRCLIEYSLEQTGTALTVIGKVHAKRLEEASYTVQTVLWNGAFNHSASDLLCVPEPLGTIPTWNMWLQRKVPGWPATKFLRRPGTVGLAQHIAELAHKLHSAGVPTTRPRHTLEEEVRILHERLPLVAQSRPQLADRLDRLLAAVDELASTIPQVRRCGIHRDFYPDQVMVDNDRLYLLDFDLYCEGDPAIDLGNFVAHLRE